MSQSEQQILGILRGVSIIMHMYPGQPLRVAVRHACWCEASEPEDTRRVVECLKRVRKESEKTIDFRVGRGISEAICHLTPPRTQIIVERDPFAV